MARKKKIEQVDTGILRLEESEFLAIQLHDARMKMNQSEVHRWQAVETAKKMEHAQELAAIRAKVRENKKSWEDAANDKNAAVSKAESRLGISLSKYSILDSGELRYIGHLDEGQEKEKDDGGSQATEGKRD